MPWEVQGASDSLWYCYKYVNNTCLVYPPNITGTDGQFDLDRSYLRTEAEAEMWCEIFTAQEALNVGSEKL
jgi:hypothetical protein